MKTQNQEGITLVALIITIIVMMILVGIIVGTVIKNGLFNTTQGVAKEMQESKDNELDFSTGDILNEFVGSSGTGEKIITFTLDGVKYEINEGTTWSQAIPTINSALYGSFNHGCGITEGCGWAVFERLEEENNYVATYSINLCECGVFNNSEGQRKGSVCFIGANYGPEDTVAPGDEIINGANYSMENI